jgi:hypothetical protein
MIFIRKFCNPVLLALCLLTVSYVLFLSQYEFYGGDEHANQLTGILHYFDKTLYGRDFTMQAISPLVLKNLPHLALFVIARFIHVSVAQVYFCFYLFLVFSFLLILYQTTFNIVQRSCDGVLACVLVIVFASNNYLSSSAYPLINNVVASRFIGTVLHLLSLYLVLQRKMFMSVLVATLLFYIHGHSSLWTMLSVLFVAAGKKEGLAKMLKYFSTYLLAALPVILHLLITFKPFANNSTLFTLKDYAVFRFPHHIYPEAKLVLIMTFVICSSIICARLKPQIIPREVIFWITPLIIVYLIGIIFTRYFSSDVVILLICLRVDVYLRIIYLILVAIRLSDVIRCSFNKCLTKTYDTWGIAFIALQILFLVKIFTWSPAKIILPRINPPQNEFTDIAYYVKTHVPKDALLITPPFLEGFRLYSERSIVVDFKTMVLGRGHWERTEWMSRLQDICNVKKFQNQGFPALRECEEGFKRMDCGRRQSLCQKYKADYFLTYSNNLRVCGEEALIYENSKFSLLICSRQDLR